MKVSENWLREHVSVDATFEEIAEALTMAGLEANSVERDTSLSDASFEVEITSNRPDWLSYQGIAREVAALYNTTVNPLECAVSDKRVEEKNFSISIDAKDACPFYSGVIIRGVSVGESPKEIQDKLKAVGLRPVNLIVDLTNVVLYEMGQPMHAFDLAKLGGACINVRFAKEKDTFLAINHNEYTLRTNDLMICDGHRSVALAGIMGGADTEVSESTTDILLESAFFTPVGIRNTARFHTLSTDASYRFERKVDIAAVRTAQDRFIVLLKKYGSYTSVSERILDGADEAVSHAISFDCDEIADYLGVHVPKDVVSDILTKLGVSVSDAGGSLLNVVVSTARPDLLRPVDLIEEVARIYGYDKVPETFPARILQKDGLDDPIFTVEATSRDVCTHSGCYEIVPFALINEAKIDGIVKDSESFVRLVNPMNKDLRLMCPSLIPGMLDVVAKNVAQGEEDIRLFEIAHVYTRIKNEVLPNEGKRLGVALYGARVKTWCGDSRASDFFDLKGIIEHVGDSLGVTFLLSPSQSDYCQDVCSFSVLIGDVCVGVLGKAHFDLLKRYDIDRDVYVCEIDTEAVSSLLKLDKTHVENSKYPSVKRDIAVIVDVATLVGDLEKTIRSVSPDLITSVTLFDVFEGGKQLPKGKKSVAFALEFCSYEQTLSGDLVQDICERIYGKLNENHGATLREA